MAIPSTAWKPGQSGNPNGRPKKLLDRPDEYLHKVGITPIQKLLELIPTLEPSQQARLWLDIMSYCHAKPKEIIFETDGLENLSDEELIRVIKEKIPQLRSV